MTISKSLSRPKVEIFHNILWSKYKGGVFSELYRQTQAEGLPINFVQIAETQGSRALLSKIDFSYHNYPFELLFRGAYEAVLWPRLAIRVFTRVLTSNAELVILPCYDTLEYWLMLLAAILSRKKRAVFCDSTALDRPQTWFKSLLKRAFFKQCHGFFAYGQRSGEYLKMHGVQPNLIYTRCQAAALPHNYTPEQALAQRLEYFPSKESPRVLYVGRLAQEKQLDSLVAAFALVRSEFPTAVLALVGAGPLKLSLQTQAEELGLQRAVLWLGSMDIDELAHEYASATCLVLPSGSEPWGLVVNEALSYGCPTIVSDRCGCVPELVIEGVTGFSFGSGDVAALATCIMICIRKFSRNTDSARACIDHMKDYTPTTAARQMLVGCRKMLNS